MNGNFRLGIELGNDAMQDHADIAEALENLASHLRRFGFDGDVEGSIRDANGNTVGSWEVAEEAPLPVLDLGGPEGGRLWRVISGHDVDHPDVRAAAVYARATGSVGCTYNDAQVERVEPTSDH